jgi:hypothetical protein
MPPVVFAQSQSLREQVSHSRPGSPSDRSSIRAQCFWIFQETLHLSFHICTPFKRSNSLRSSTYLHDAMLEYWDESRIEVLSISQDLGRIAQCFFRDDESTKDADERTGSSDALQSESTLAALAEECRKRPVFE